MTKFVNSGTYTLQDLINLLFSPFLCLGRIICQTHIEFFLKQSKIGLDAFVLTKMKDNTDYHLVLRF